MRDLNDKLTGNSLTADEWNDMPSELQNIIENFGIALSAGDLDQLGKAIVNYVAQGSFYSVGGTANALELSPVGTNQGPTAYRDHMQVRFSPAAGTNTGAVTIDVNGLGVKDLLDQNGNALTTGELFNTREYSAVYFPNTDDFRLQTYADKSSSEIIQGSWTFTPSQTLSGGFVSNGTSTFNSPSTFNSSSTFNSPSTFNNSSTFNSPSTFASPARLNNNTFLQGKTGGGVNRNLVGIDNTDVMELGHNSNAVEFRNNGTLDVTNHYGATRNAHGMWPDAQGIIDVSGSIFIAWGIASSTLLFPGVYEVVFSASIASRHVDVTPVNNVDRTHSITVSNNTTVIVYMFNAAGAPANSTFNISTHDLLGV